MRYVVSVQRNSISLIFLNFVICRASSRILLNSFRKKGLQVSRKQQKALEDLKTKAWSLDQMILFFVYLGSGLEDQKETINDIKEIVKFMLPEIMERTAVDLSIQLFYSSKVFFTFIIYRYRVMNAT